MNRELLSDVKGAFADQLVDVLTGIGEVIPDTPLPDDLDDIEALASATDTVAYELIGFQARIRQACIEAVNNRPRPVPLRPVQPTPKTPPPPPKEPPPPPPKDGVSIELPEAADRLSRVACELRQVQQTLSCEAMYDRIRAGHWEDGIERCLTDAIGDTLDALGGVHWAIEHPPER